MKNHLPIYLLDKRVSLRHNSRCHRWVKAGLALLCLAGSLSSSQAVLFPIQKNQSGAYDTSVNLVTGGFANWYATTGHAIYAYNGFATTGVAPEWVVTANHLHWGPGSWVTSDTAQHTFVEAHQIGGVDEFNNPIDLAVVKVSPPLPAYSRIARSFPGDGNVVTIYGASAYDGNVPLVDDDGSTKGWSVILHSYGWEPIRRGYGRVTSSGRYFGWPWRNADASFGDNAAGLLYGDSGGGNFYGTEVVGVNVGGLYNANTTESGSVRINATASCDGVSYVFNNSGLLKCATTDPAATDYRGGGCIKLTGVNLQTQASYLTEIFGWIAPPIKVNAGGSPAVAGWTTWTAGTQYSNPSASINTTGLPQPAPIDVYRSVNKITKTHGASLSYTASNLIKHDTYRVRLHFSALTGSGAGWYNEKIRINGNTQTVIDPEANPGYATIVEYPTVSPTASSQITVEVAEDNTEGNVEISGIEIIHNL